MTVDDIIPQRAQDALAQAHARLSRLAALDPARMSEALTWLAGYSPSTFDATLDATEPCTDDDIPTLRTTRSRSAQSVAQTSESSCDSAWTGATSAATAPPPARSNSSTPATLQSSPGAPHPPPPIRQPDSRGDCHTNRACGAQRAPHALSLLCRDYRLSSRPWARLSTATANVCRD